MGLEVWIEMAGEWDIDNVIKKSTNNHPSPIQLIDQKWPPATHWIFLLIIIIPCEWFAQKNRFVPGRLCLWKWFSCCVSFPHPLIHNFQTHPMVISEAVSAEIIALSRAELYRPTQLCCHKSAELPRQRMKKSHKHRILLWPSGVRIVENQLILLCQNH